MLQQIVMQRANAYLPSKQAVGMWTAASGRPAGRIAP